MEKRNINIHELAKIIGVSSATVSRALNGLADGNMKKETYLKVIEAAKNYRFMPNQLSAGLRLGYSKTIGIIFPTNINPYYSMLANLIEEKAFKNGYFTYICNSNYDPSRELAYIKKLKAQMVAVIFLCSTGLSKSAIEELNSEKSPIILLDEEVKNYQGSSIVIDDCSGGNIGTSFLIKNNHTDIAIIAGPKKLNSTKERLRGAFLAIKDNEISIEKNIFYGDYTIESGKKITEIIFKENNSISALFCFNDLMAIGASLMLRELNKNIPADVSILGYDNITYSEIVAPSISTIATPLISLVDAGINLVLDKKNNPSLEKKFVITPYLIERESTSKKLNNRS
jgi:LacI family transcriptional regulator